MEGYIRETQTSELENWLTCHNKENPEEYQTKLKSNEFSIQGKSVLTSPQWAEFFLMFFLGVHFSRFRQGDLD
jgi:hypothetical protein